MNRKRPCRLLALSVCLILLLSACASKGNTLDAPSYDSDVLTWTGWNGFDNFLELTGQTYPEIEWEYTTYAGANRTGHIGTQLTGVPFATVFNLAKTGWFSTPEGVNWERDFLGRGTEDRLP